MVAAEGVVTLEKKEFGPGTNCFTKYLTLPVAKLFFY